MVLLFPQWQGAGVIPRIVLGAEQLASLLPPGVAHQRLVTSEDASLALDQRILGRKALVENHRSARELLDARGPERLLTLGGDCSVELAPVEHLAHRDATPLHVVWIDAHGDLNTPASSPSHTLHGMPLRLLLGEGDAELVGTLNAHRVVLVGTRDLDPAERSYLDRTGLPILGPDEVVAQLRRRGATRVYVHCDLDALDPSSFASVCCPTPGGLGGNELLGLLADVFAQFDVVGMGITEYLPRDAADALYLARLLALVAPRFG